MPRLRPLAEISAADTTQAIQIADHVWWVGHYLPGDPFQCHAYLLEQGDQSVLFDPGSKLTFKHTLRKVEQIIPLDNIRYFICHHQDPDITGIMPLLDQLICRDDAMLLSHWRTNVLLKHYGLKMDMACVEKFDWKLDLGERTLRFIFTPYLHFPGAFCTFDETSGILFSSDIFGGFTEEWSLVAKDEGYFESIRPFHEHYMPSQEILLHGLLNLEKYPIKMIAPQHGSLIPEHLVSFIFERLKSIDCGLFLLTRKNSDVHRLSGINRMLRTLTETMILHRDFHEIAMVLLKLLQPLFPVQVLEFYTQLDNGEIWYMGPKNRFRGTISEKPPVECLAFLGKDRVHWQKNHQGPFLTFTKDHYDQGETALRLLLPLFSPGHQTVKAVTIFHLSESISVDEEIEQMLSEASVSLAVAVERESIYRSMDQERQRFYEQSIRDPLTNLYTRFYMQESLRRLFDIHDRDPDAPVAAALFDIDFFKKVNDTFGHNAGDQVLRQVAEVLLLTTRASDIPVRLGGEEFVVFLVGQNVIHAEEIAERVRKQVTQLTFPGEMEGHQLTISCGVAWRHQKEPLTDLLERGDAALYQAKNSGRNRVCVASD
ncbi:diguanylate cyclase [Magnetococcales bacterium HHB-1]